MLRTRGCVSATEYRSVTAWKSASGTYLADSVLETVYVQSLTKCVQHCATRCPHCASVNAAVTAGAGAGHAVNGWWKCELNKVIGNSSTLTLEDDWQYYDVDVARCH